MNWFEKFLTAIALLFEGGEYRIQPYGAFHLIWLAAAVLGCIAAVIFFRDISARAMRITLTVTGFTLILLEVYKQLVFSYAAGGAWTYQWHAFPFQFCSTPMYIMPLAGLLKNGKLRDMCMSYLATFSVMAGLIVMLFAGGVFNTASVGVCIQTMVHHSSMLIVGVLILANDRRKLGVKYWLKSLPVFAALYVIAFIINAAVYYGVPGAGADMYYISPYVITEGIFLATALKTVLLDNNLYFIYPILYFIVFSLLSLAAVYSAKGITAVGGKLRRTQE